MKVIPKELKKVIISAKDSHGPMLKNTEKLLKNNKHSDFFISPTSSFDSSSAQLNPLFDIVKSFESKSQRPLQGGFDVRI